MATDTRKLFGNRLRQARKRAGLTSEQVAERVGVVRQAIVSWESGKTSPTNEHLKQIAQLYRVTTDWLLYGEGQAFPQSSDVIFSGSSPPDRGLRVREDSHPYLERERQTEFEHRLRAAAQQLSPEDMKTVLDLIAFLRDRRKTRL